MKLFSEWYILREEESGREIELPIAGGFDEQWNVVLRVDRPGGRQSEFPKQVSEQLHHMFPQCQPETEDLKGTLVYETMNKEVPDYKGGHPDNWAQGWSERSRMFISAELNGVDLPKDLGQWILESLIPEK